MAVGLSGYGVIPLVLGDTRPDYIRMVDRLGGHVITLGRNRGALNVLDPGEAPDAAARLRAAGFDREAEEVLADAHGLRLNMLSSLITDHGAAQERAHGAGGDDPGPRADVAQ